MPKTVLIVEDYEDARVMMKVLVELCGYKAIEAEDGYDAIEKVKEYSPELIFMDLSMPRMDGIAATAKIRGLEGGADVPIRRTYRLWGPAWAEKPSKPGVTEVIPKPMDFERLQPLLDKYVASASTSTSAS